MGTICRGGIRFGGHQDRSLPSSFAGARLKTFTRPTSFALRIVCLVSRSSTRFSSFQDVPAFNALEPADRVHVPAEHFQHRRGRSSSGACAGIIAHLHLPCAICCRPPSMSGAAPTPPNPTRAPLPAHAERCHRPWLIAVLAVAAVRAPSTRPR